MDRRIIAVAGGLGLFVALFGFVSAALASDSASAEIWSVVGLGGLVAFLWSQIKAAE